MDGIAFDPNAHVLYGTDATGHELLTIDATTGAAVGVGPLGFDEVRALAFDPNRNKLYGADAETDQLILIDRVSGAGSAIGPIGFLRVEDLSFDPIANKLYGVDAPRESSSGSDHGCRHRRGPRGSRSSAGEGL